jgi:hypothetical protein
MSDEEEKQEQHPWDRQPHEPIRWFMRFRAYLNLGPTRSIEKVFQNEFPEKEKGRQRPSNIWYVRSKEWLWKKRAEEWDISVANKALADAEKRRIEILTTGLALKHERVHVLKDLAETMLKDLSEEERRWLRDAKGIGQGEYFQVIELERFNAPEVEQLRGVLDDLAAELGERQRKLEHTGPEGGPIPVSVEDMEAIRQRRWEQAKKAIDDEGVTDPTGAGDG